MRKGHIDAFHKEAQHLKKKEERVLFKIYKWKIRHKHLFNVFTRIIGVLFGVAMGTYYSMFHLVFFRDAILLSLLLLILSYLISHHNRRRMFNEKSMLLSLEHALIQYVVSAILLVGVIFFIPGAVSSFAEFLLVMSSGAFFGSIAHSYL